MITMMLIIMGHEFLQPDLSFHLLFFERPAPAHHTVDDNEATAGDCLVDELRRCVEIPENKISLNRGLYDTRFLLLA